MVVWLLLYDHGCMVMWCMVMFVCIWYYGCGGSVMILWLRGYGDGVIGMVVRVLWSGYDCMDMVL